MGAGGRAGLARAIPKARKTARRRGQRGHLSFLSKTIIATSYESASSHSNHTRTTGGVARAGKAGLDWTGLDLCVGVVGVGMIS